MIAGAVVRRTVAVGSSATHGSAHLWGTAKHRGEFAAYGGSVTHYAKVSLCATCAEIRRKKELWGCISTVVAMLVLLGALLGGLVLSVGPTPKSV
jgi:hypothetical protein